jgi:hypothetical protein
VASTGATFHTILGQNIEDVRTFAGQTVTLSFWAKADASRSIRPILIQRFGSGGSSNVTTDTASNVDLTTSWTRYTRTFTLPSIVGKTIGDNNSLGLNLDSQSLNATQTIDIWGVQLEAGPVATPFRRNANSLQGELAACQRYYWRSGPGALYLGHPTAGFVFTSTDARLLIFNPVTMRATPSSVEWSNVGINDSANATWPVTAFSSVTGTMASSVIATISGATSGRAARLINNNNVDGYFALNAEL